MKKFLYALKGIAAAVLSEHNMRFHIAAAFYVVCAGFVTRVEAADWTRLVLCIALVMAMELMNTAVEYLCDALHPGRDPRIGAVKDAAAGAVLVCAVGAAVVGGLIFFRKARVEALVETFTAYPILIAAAVITVPAAVLFIRGRKRK